LYTNLSVGLLKRLLKFTEQQFLYPGFKALRAAKRDDLKKGDAQGFDN